MKNPKTAGPVVVSKHVLCRVLYSESGFSITELMVALLVGMLLIAASYATFIAQNRSYVAQEAVSEVNTQSHIAYDMLANDIKMAGFGVADDMNLTPVRNRDGTDFRSPLTPVDNAGSPAGNNDPAEGTDTLTLVAGFERAGTLAAAASVCTNCTITVLASDLSSRIATLLTFGVSPGVSIDGVEFTYVNSISGTGSTRTLGVSNVSANYPQGRPLYLVEPVTYAVDNDCNNDGSSTDPCLRRRRSTDTAGGGDVVAENVQDLQLAYALDVDDDGVLDTGNYETPDPGTWDFGTIRSVRVNILARSAMPDPNFAGQGNPPASIENHNLAATNDSFKRRWWQSIVTVRND